MVKKPRSRIREQAKLSLKELIQNGFPIAAWDVTVADHMSPVDCLIHHSVAGKTTTEQERIEMCLTMNQQLLQERTRNTRSEICDIEPIVSLRSYSTSRLL